MLFRLFKNTNMMALFFVIIAVATCIYSSLTYKCITLFERELNKLKNHVATMSTTMESMLQHNVVSPVAPVCGGIQQNVEKVEENETPSPQTDGPLPTQEYVPEKPREEVDGGEDTHSQSSFEDEMLRINEIVTSIQTECGEGEGGEKEGDDSRKKSSAPASAPAAHAPAKTPVNTQPPADFPPEKKTPKLDMNALSQMKYGELQSFVKNKFGVMLRTNKLDMLKKVEEMASASASA